MVGGDACTECLRVHGAELVCNSPQLSDDRSVILTSEGEFNSTMNDLQNEMYLHGTEAADVNFFQDPPDGLDSSLLPVSLWPYNPRFMDSSVEPFLCDLERLLSPETRHETASLESMHQNSIEREEGAELIHLFLGNGNNEQEFSSSNSELQIYDILDFYLSESCPSLNFDSCFMASTNESTASFEEYMCPNIIADMADERVVDSIGQLHESLNSDCDPSVQLSYLKMDETFMFIKTTSSELSGEATVSSREMEVNKWCDPQVLSEYLPDLMDLDSTELAPRSSILPARKKSVTLVLDLDETLVHSSVENYHNADFSLQVNCNSRQQTVYVKQRPHLLLFLEKVAEMFEIVIFTASQRIYASQLLDRLDPDRRLISRRFYRESCIYNEGGYLKDLVILGVDLAKVAIVDNTPEVYQLQVENGIPILSWFDNPWDEELLNLLPFLERLATAEDVRPLIAEKFGKKVEQQQL